MHAYMQRLHWLFEWIQRLAYLNLVWVLFTILGLGLFGFFPSTLAMYTVTRKWLRNEEVSVLPLFWDSFRSEFWRCQLLGVLLLFIGGILIGDLQFFAGKESHALLFLKCLCVIGSFLFLLMLGYVFPVMAHFEGRILILVKNAFVICITDLTRGIFMLFGGLFIIGVFLVFPAGILFFWGSAFAYWGTWIAQKSFNKLTSLQVAR